MHGSLLAECRDDKEIRKAFTGSGTTLLYGISASQKSWICGAASTGPLLVIVHDREQKERWERDLAFLAPERDCLPLPIIDRVYFTTAARSVEAAAARMSALYALRSGKCVAVVATPDEAAQYVVSPDALEADTVLIRHGEEVDRNPLFERLVSAGYERVEQVEHRGQFAVRGDIVDIFPVQERMPYRLESFGDEIDTIRTFSVDSQRSVDNVDEVVIFPLRPNDAEADTALTAYCAGVTVVYDEPQRIRDAFRQLHKEDGNRRDVYASWGGLIKASRAERSVCLSLMPQRLTEFGPHETMSVPGRALGSFNRQMHVFTDEMKQRTAEGNRVLVVMSNAQRREAVERALREAGIEGVRMDEGLLTSGFELPRWKTVVVTEGDIFGKQKRRIGRKAEKGRAIDYFSDLSAGDYVVHDVHGIGRYVGLKTIETEGIHKDYIEIDYAGKDCLFLPADNLDQIQKYIGNEGEVPKLHRMGGGDWKRSKAKAQASVDELAEKLAALYARREVVEGFAFLPDQPWQREFEEAFPYEETPDQLQAIREIKESMERPVPMDRLLCGDVGFGKTEVAMRAVFKAVMSGKQVAVLVPTTILSQQHFRTFSERFANFGVETAVLNRFSTPAEKRAVLAGIRDKKIDVLIGTHALLGKNVEFADLGLLVVDEEQRFGVAQKEKRKAISERVDVLTLSATPIPRTLHMSLVGVREMSVINTPPEERLPVQSYVAEYDLQLVAEAIRRELQRGGQVYVVYNRVESIHRIGEELEIAMPGLNYAIAHGRMSGNETEAVMSDFYEGRYDVLLATSIVESGLDIPNANTVIIYDADRLGLAQL